MVAENPKNDLAKPDRIGSLPDSGLEFSVATQVAEVVEAWELVHAEYIRARLIDPSPHRVHTHSEAVHPGTAVIVGKIRSLVVSTMSAYVDRPGGLPLDHSCGDAMQGLRRDGHRLVEVGLFADRREKIARSFSALLNLMRQAFFFAMHSGATDIVIGVHPHHADFYRRLLGFVAFAEPTYCQRVNDHPMVPLRLDIHGQLALERPPKGIAFFKANPLEAEAFDDRVVLTRAKVAGTAIDRYLRQQEQLIAADARARRSSEAF